MSEQFFTYFSQLLSRPVVDTTGRRVGVFYDFSMNLNNDIFPRAKSIVIRRGWPGARGYTEVPVTDVERTMSGFRLKRSASSLNFQHDHIDSEFALRRDVLDQQIVDVENRKVVRVNDVHLLRVENHYYIAHVEVGLRGIIRRLDWEPFVDFMVWSVNRDASYLSREDLVSWKDAQLLAIGSKKNVLKLDLAQKKISKIPPVALAEIMEDLDVYEQAGLLRTLPFDTQRKVFADMAADDKLGLLEQLEDREAVQLISNIPSDEAADLLLNVGKDRVRDLLTLMESKTARRLRMLLGYQKNSAGGLMGTEFLSLGKDATVRDAIEKVKSSVDSQANITTIYIVDERNKYIGTTTIHRFINEPPDKAIRETCHQQNVFVRTDDGMEKVAILLEQYKYTAIPVLDENDVLVGSITVDDVMEELIALAWGKYKDQL